MPRQSIQELMQGTREAIKGLAPGSGGNGLSLDLRAALLNLDAALARALSHDGNDTAGADQLDVYSRLEAVREMAKTEGPKAIAAVKPVLITLERRRRTRALRQE